MKIILNLAIFLGAMSAFAKEKTPRAAAIPMAPVKGDSYAGKPDFADVEREFPIPQSLLDQLVPVDLASLSQEELNQVYARLKSGPIPDGAYDGTIVMGDSLMLTVIQSLLAVFRPEFLNKNLEDLGEMFWKGKIFYKKDLVLRNRIGDLGHEMFGAKLYCGQSLLDSRKESVIIDYAYSTEILPPSLITNPVPELDVLVDRNHLGIRDEIRMVRPGFYLGRAYIRSQIFAVNFILFNKEVAERNLPADRAQECRTGETSGS